MVAMELEPPPLGAVTTVGTHEAAPHIVSSDELSADRERDVAAFRRGLALARVLLGSRLSAHAEASFHAVRNQQVERPLHAFGEVTIGQFGAHELARLLHLVVEALTRGELQLVAGRSQRLHAGSRRRGSPRLQSKLRLCRGLWPPACS